MILQVLSNLVLLRFCDCVSRVEQQQPKCQHLHAKPTLYFHAPLLKSPRSTSCYPVGTPRSLHRVSLILFSLLFPISLLHLQLCCPEQAGGCCAGAVPVDGSFPSACAEQDGNGSKNRLAEGRMLLVPCRLSPGGQGARLCLLSR